MNLHRSPHPRPTPARTTTIVRQKTMWELNVKDHLWNVTSYPWIFFFFLYFFFIIINIIIGVLFINIHIFLYYHHHFLSLKSYLWFVSDFYYDRETVQNDPKNRFSSSKCNNFSFLQSSKWPNEWKNVSHWKCLILFICLDEQNQFWGYP